MNNCPLCNGRAVGRVATNQYYCWNCLIEYDGNNKIYEVEEDGSLTSAK